MAVGRYVVGAIIGFACGMMILGGGKKSTDQPVVEKPASHENKKNSELQKDPAARYIVKLEPFVHKTRTSEGDREETAFLVIDISIETSSQEAADLVRVRQRAITNHLALEANNKYAEDWLRRARETESLLLNGLLPIILAGSNVPSSEINGIHINNVGVRQSI